MTYKSNMADISNTSLSVDNMFNQYNELQFVEYNKAVKYYTSNFSKLIEIEKFVMDEILHCNLG